jgi:hypothetical protein
MRGKEQSRGELVAVARRVASLGWSPALMEWFQPIVVGIRGRAFE